VETELGLVDHCGRQDLIEGDYEILRNCGFSQVAEAGVLSDEAIALVPVVARKHLVLVIEEIIKADVPGILVDRAGALHVGYVEQRGRRSELALWERRLKWLDGWNRLRPGSQAGCSFDEWRR